MSKKSKDTFSIKLDKKVLDIERGDVEINSTGVLFLTLRDCDELSKFNFAQRYRHTLEMCHNTFSYTSSTVSYMGKELRFDDGFYYVLKYRVADATLKNIKEVKEDE